MLSLQWYEAAKKQKHVTYMQELDSGQKEPET
jgi:hypothetical protein